MKFLSHRPKGPDFGRPEDRLRPVPIAEMGPGVRQEDKETGAHARRSER
jgi:hypothetical protein